ncbi:hypothetical protein P170DRAFT_408078 [Aspergillus steynii IBT 23096]|uniref:LITAF domain-containing protein n=1 Tax=Aspergillus steynii IBT 23096 TaxID=1392250 RepID=A0A2I2G885_9EURO|nr:uncharacterized protein P170DRAFT_408078 [Aspergillus steynii IBT 23096]PLB49097.1 hypothetical protein P170DRAFT_408078 [Aspergillus steynii IBT 23096]
MSHDEKVASAPPLYEQQPTPIHPPTAHMVPPMEPPAWQPGMPHPSGYNTSSPLHTLQRGPAPVDCPICSHREMTRVDVESGNTTHGWAAVICCCFCLGCIPYLISSLKDVNHHCGKCGAMLATFHASGRTEVHQNVRQG